jgi:hypothetical protein
MFRGASAAVLWLGAVCLVACYAAGGLHQNSYESNDWPDCAVLQSTFESPAERVTPLNESSAAPRGATAASAGPMGS